MTSTQRTLGAFLVLLVIAGSFWAYLRVYPRQTPDPLLTSLWERVAETEFYAQQIQTDMNFPDRVLSVEGVYYNDSKNGSFASFSTSTIHLSEYGLRDNPLSFTLQNIAIGDEVYTKINTQDPLLMSTIPASEDWQRFTRSTIPKEYEGIAVPGPIMDNLQILGQKGALLTLVSTSTLPNTETLYTFKLSGRQAPRNQGNLQTVLERLGPEGTIEVSVAPKTALPTMLVFKSYNYRSTTTISQINQPVPIQPPPVSM